MRSLHLAALGAFGAGSALACFCVVIIEARHLPEIVSGDRLASMRQNAALCASALLVLACVALCVVMMALRRHAEGHR